MGEELTSKYKKTNIIMLIGFIIACLGMFASQIESDCVLSQSFNNTHIVEEKCDGEPFQEYSTRWWIPLFVFGFGLFTMFYGPVFVNYN